MFYCKTSHLSQNKTQSLLHKNKNSHAHWKHWHTTGTRLLGFVSMYAAGVFPCHLEALWFGGAEVRGIHVTDEPAIITLYSKRTAKYAELKIN